MPKNDTSINTNRDLKALSNEAKTRAANELGFPSLKSLIDAAGVDSGTFSGVCRGKRAITDEAADLLIRSIQEQNGWSYLEATHYFAEVLNYIQRHNESYYGTSVREITRMDVKRWHQSYFEQLEPAQHKEHKATASFNLKVSTQELLEQVYSFLQDWETKHDLNEFTKVKQSFEDHYPDIIEPSIKRSMRAGGRHYEAIKKIYPEIRYVAHLCHKFDFVVKMSTWLINQAESKDDVPTKVSAVATYAWELTSQNTPSTLKMAQQHIDEIWNIAYSSSFLRVVAPDYMDTIALLAELRLRLAIRQTQYSPSPLTALNFDQLLKESGNFLKAPDCFKELPSNLRNRYELSLSYQHGVYLYHIKEYQESRLKFEEIAKETRSMGWVRVEQAAYSWLATLFEAMGLYQELSEVLQQIDVACLINSSRKQIRDNIIKRNAKNEIIAKLKKIDA